jgi:two-component system, NarL family, nitrate/nitrite response regulator NarL
MLVERTDGVELAGRVGSGQEAIATLADDPPDLMILDFQLGDMTGLVVLEHVIGHGLPTRVLFVSGRLQGEDAYAIVEGGAHGLIEKSATFDEIADAITRVAHGQMVLSGRVQAAVMAGVRDRRNQPAVVLSDRELAILEGLARGLTAPGIGRELELSTSTVKTYLQRLYESGVVNVEGADGCTCWTTSGRTSRSRATTRSWRTRAGSRPTAARSRSPTRSPPA